MASRSASLFAIAAGSVGEIIRAELIGHKMLT